MYKWVTICSELLASTNKLLIVHDQDELLELPILKQVIENKGFKVLSFEDALKFRISWELNYKTDAHQYIIIKNFKETVLPDILAYGEEIVLTLNLFFKRLDYKALKALNPIYFDSLLIKCELLFEKLSYDASVKFILKQLFDIDVDSLNSPERILAVFIHLHTNSLNLNQSSHEYLSNKASKFFNNHEVFYDSKEFKYFLGFQWQAFLEKQAEALNFEEPYLYKELNYYFSKDSLPIKEKQSAYEIENHFKAQLESLKQGIDITKVESWFELIKPLAEVKRQFLASDSLKLNYSEEFKALEVNINKSFQEFLNKNYAFLQSRSPFIKPFVVSQILDYLNYKNYEKIILLVIDGLNFWQWLMIESALSSSIKGIKFNTSACLAWIPTITAYSRQAIFKGSIPDLNKDSSYEKKFWFDYWQKKHLSEAFINYQKLSLDDSDTKKLDSIINYRRVGLVCNDLDDIMHGAVLAGNQMLYENTNFWLKKATFILELVEKYHNNGFHIFITSDHGSIEATGFGNLKNLDTFGSLSRSKRYLKFANEDLASNFVTVNKTSLNIQKNNDTVWLKDNLAFYNKDKLIITHGGSHFWEVIVPFIEIL